MKAKSLFALVLINILLLTACSKDAVKQQPAPQNLSFKSGLVSFSANGQLINAVIDTDQNTILVTTKDTSGQSKLVINFTLQNQANASINNQTITSGTALNLTNPLNFTVTSADKSRSTTFKLSAQTELGYVGMPGVITAQNNLARDYNYYFDQFDSSTWQFLNCGPASSTMAIKWADSTFTGKPVDARNTYSPGGGWWTTGEVQGYLTTHGIDNVTDTLSDFNNQIKNAIDKNNAVILCLDMNYVPYNESSYQHVGKFYPTTPSWGHFILIKGYKQMGTNLYLDAYDPYSQGIYYISSFDLHQLKGQDRYYNSGDLKIATTNWWSYAIIIAPKGQKVISSIRLRVNSLSKPIPIAYGR
ncbi:MAG TPA: C39 family peptidase [Mucilaginibacter sp.]|nr:C39 family peptidase [Mucilaginibacter sp.]